MLTVIRVPTDKRQMIADRMDLVTASTSPTLLSEWRVHPLGRRSDGKRTGAATTGDPNEAGWLGGDADLFEPAPWPGLVLQMVGPLQRRRRQRLARPLARAAALPPSSLHRDAPS